MKEYRSKERIRVLHDHLSQKRTSNEKTDDGAEDVLQGEKDHIGFLRAERIDRQLTNEEETNIRHRMGVEREKRAKQADNVGNNNQYIHLNEKYLKDPYTADSGARQALSLTKEVVIVGGGFSALLTAARLQEIGVTEQLVIEKGGAI
jgi:hypothetical protein